MRTLSGLDRGPAKGIPLRIDCCEEDLSAATFNDQDERYALSVDIDGITVKTSTPLGVVRALATLRQLLQFQDGGWALRTTTIDDSPRYRWRGLMIDTARHFISLDSLKRQIDAMEQVKLNVLHLHLSDNEGFRVQSLAFPRLTENQHNQHYSQIQIRDLVTYAASRGVRIVPEFDIPGHSAAVIRAYPELGSSDKAKTLYGGVLDPSKPATYDFVKRLFSEMAGLFPDPLFHVGGDEVTGEDWASNAGIQTFMKQHKLKNKVELQGYFMRQVGDIVHQLGKQMMGWEEVAYNDLPTSTHIQSWTTSNYTHLATLKGHPVVVSAGYYLDHLENASTYYLRDPEDAAAVGITPEMHATVKALNQPLLDGVFAQSKVIRPNQTFSITQKQLIMGGEAAQWSEILTDEQIDGRTWPRAAALAERFWSPSSVRDIDDMHRRLVLLDGQLDRLGLQARSNRMRMAERLAPGKAEVITALTDITTTVRHFAHAHTVFLEAAGMLQGPAQQYTAPADIATPSNPVALSFNLDAAEFARGRLELADSLEARMRAWKANDARYRAIANSHPDLAAALPTSAATAALADIGLHALASVQAGQRVDAAWLARARAAVEVLHKQEQASESLFATIINQKNQPPADLIITILPAIDSLLDAAQSTP